MRKLKNKDKYNSIKKIIWRLKGIESHNTKITNNNGKKIARFFIQ